MHPEILNANQQQLLPFIKKYVKNYYLVGGTAVAFHIGHRRSIDFDLFTERQINRVLLKKAILASGFASRVIVEKADQIHFILNEVKLTFFQFPFAIDAPVSYQS